MLKNVRERDTRKGERRKREKGERGRGIRGKEGKRHAFIALMADARDPFHPGRLTWHTGLLSGLFSVHCSPDTFVKVLS